jgi:hypothetical protein
LVFDPFLNTVSMLRKMSEHFAIIFV